MMILRGYLLLAAMLVSLALAGCSGQEDNEFSRVDYNKDGKIIFEELIVVFPDLTVEEFLAADANHDGVLDAKEFERFRGNRQAGAKPSPAAENAKAPAATPAPAVPVPPDQTPAAAPAPAAPAPVAPAPTPDALPGREPAQSPAPAVSGQEQLPATEPTARTAAPAVPPPVRETPPMPVEPAATATQAEPSAPARPETYVVTRGDTLSRIAKRFGVTQQAIMDANGLKNADRLEAGASLTIPGTAGGTASPAETVAVPAGVSAFVTDFFAKSAGNDVNALMDLYADTVEYYNKGKSGRDIVRQDKAAYFGRWPRRSYTPGPVAVTSVPGAEGMLRVTVPVTFSAARDGAATSGQAVFTFVLRPDGQGYRIAAERGAVSKRDTPRK